MIRPGVAEALSFCPRGMPAARRKSRGRTTRFEASSLTMVVTAKTWRGFGAVSRTIYAEASRALENLQAAWEAGDRTAESEPRVFAQELIAPTKILSERIHRGIL